MIPEFAHLNEVEQSQLVDAIARITVLIAGADGEIETQETDWAEKLTQIRTYAGPEQLKTFYEKVGEGFHDSLHEMIEDLPDDTEQRNKILSDELSELNDILPKLPEKFAAILYQSYVSFAEHVAKASGGFLRFWSIGPEEKELIGLPMINPIEYHEEDEDHLEEEG